MRIHAKIDGEDRMIDNPNCTGCMCHEMAMVFGNDKNKCAECGCPKTLAGFQAFVEKHGYASSSED